MKKQGQNRSLEGEAFGCFALGRFDKGLEKLERHQWWADVDDALSGPFYLQFPGNGDRGWGEAFLFASLLKRQVSDRERGITGFAHQQAASILNCDPSFCIRPAGSFTQCRELGARPPLSILRHALVGGLLSRPFQAISPLPGRAFTTCYPSRRVGVAWSSINKKLKPITEKTVPSGSFREVIYGASFQIVSFQRYADTCGVSDLLEDQANPIDRVPDEHLQKDDQKEVMEQIASLTCMVTVSTTTAHIAAAMGIPVILLAMRREGPQWFWRAQSEHSRIFYPTVRVVLGSCSASDWWERCLRPARQHLLDVLNGTGLKEHDAD